MGEFSPDNIVAYRFSSGRRKGYDTLQVDGYLTRLAEHVGRMEEELARLQGTERAALEVLQQAQIVADGTLAAAQRDADQIRQNATDGLENARKDARATLDAARAEADKTLLAARVEAEAEAERSQANFAAVEAAGNERANELDQLVEELKASAAQSSAELRSAGARLVEMAEHFEFKLATSGEQLEAPSAEELDAPDVETLVLGGDTIAPSGEAVAPGGQAVTPDGETAAPGGERVEAQ